MTPSVCCGRRLQRCDDCGGVYFAPWPFSPVFASRQVSVAKGSGKVEFEGDAIHYRPVPGFRPPYGLAVVEMDEGPRLMTNMVDCLRTPEASLPPDRRAARRLRSLPSNTNGGRLRPVSAEPVNPDPPLPIRPAQIAGGTGINTGFTCYDLFSWLGLR